MIGAKTVTSILLLAAVSALALSLGATPARFAELGASEAFAVGFFALSVSGLLCRYFRLHERSAHYLRYSLDEAPWGDESHFLGSEHRRISVGDNRGDAYDFSARVHYLIYVALAAWTALLTLDSGAIAALRALPAAALARGSEYCPEPSAAPEPARVEEEPGCALIKRAFELGYVKDLGPCAPKQAEAEVEVCTLRRHDEPVLHYAWRRLTAFEHELATKPSTDDGELERRLDHLPALYAAQRFTVGSAARASHHIFTNLPKPKTSPLASRDCDLGSRHLPARLETTSASRQLEHVIAQLLFDTRYASAVGSCRELTIHWDSPADICERLVKSPLEVLAEAGALAEVRGVLERYRVTAELQEVLPAAEGMSKLSGILRSVTRQRFVSFGCYIEEERAELASATRELTLEGQAFVAPELRVPIAKSDQAYRYVASILVPSFHYGSLLSEESQGDPLAAGIDAKFFSGQYGYLSRLDYLNEVDIFLGRGWIEERGDLMDVYPYQVHLQNYVVTFRSRYRAGEGALMNVVLLWLASIAADTYAPDARAIYLAAALEAVEDAGDRTLADAVNYISATDRNRCGSAFRRLRAQCLIEAVARNCKSQPAEKREPCAIYLDIIVTNTLSEKLMISDLERQTIMEKNRDYKSALRRELAKRYGSLAADLRLSKYYSCASPNRACIAAAIDGYCRDQEALAWQHCSAALVWFIATSRARGEP